MDDFSASPPSLATIASSRDSSCADDAAPSGNLLGRAGAVRGEKSLREWTLSRGDLVHAASMRLGAHEPLIGPLRAFFEAKAPPRRRNCRTAVSHPHTTPHEPHPKGARCSARSCVQAVAASSSTAPEPTPEPLPAAGARGHWHHRGRGRHGGPQGAWPLSGPPRRGWHPPARRPRRPSTPAGQLPRFCRRSYACLLPGSDGVVAAAGRRQPSGRGGRPAAQELRAGSDSVRLARRRRAKGGAALVCAGPMPRALWPCALEQRRAWALNRRGRALRDAD